MSTSAAVIDPAAREGDEVPRRLAIAAGVVGFASGASLAAMFAVGEPFGRISDIGNGLLGVLAAGLAWSLRPRIANGVLASTGAGACVVGSWLVVSGTTGFVLAGLVSSVGFGLVGFALGDAARSARANGRWPRRLATFGVATGLTMALGLLTVPGIALRLDDIDTAPSWVWVGFFGWLGTFILFPVWALWLGVRRPA